MAEKRPQLSPSRVRSVITTKWTNSGYRPITIRSIESYFIESNMDQDSDNFSIVIGDPRNALGAMLNRDSEIRCQLFGVGLDISYLLTGLVDDVDWDESHTLSLTGRDISSIVTDTYAEAGKWNSVRADEFIKKRAKGFGFTKFNLSPGKAQKTLRTDGSETEWEFWYRLLRREQQWLWFSSDGTLNSGVLNYNQDPSYFFGVPPHHATATQAAQWLPVERVGYRKTTQGRLGKVEIFYHTGGRQASYSASDPTTKDWMKRPLKYIESSKIHTDQKAKKAVWEEIFESKIGALEIKVLVPDIGIIIRQNRIARLNIPSIDLEGDWFVVGSRIVADSTGFMQEVRLREKGYAISKRVPDDPETTKAPGDAEDVTDCLSLSMTLPNHPEWMQFFVNAADKWRGNTEYNLYLATLLAMCEVETNFRNVRRNGGPGVDRIEWFKWTGETKFGVKSEKEWRLSFANIQGTEGLSEDYAVGPMQLYTRSYKIDADQFNGGTVDELKGNRWLPEANIMEGAHVLNRKGGGRGEATLWAAVRAYNGAGPVAEAYMKSVQNKVYNNPGYLRMVKEAIQQCAAEGEFSGAADFPTDDAISAAKRLLDYKTKGWFWTDTDVLYDLQQTAAGKQVKNGCGKMVSMKAAPLNALLFLLDSGWSCGCYSLCTGHSCLADSGNPSRHTIGLAADISHLGQGKDEFNVIGDGTQTTRKLIIEAMKMYKKLPVGSGRPNQMICNGNGSVDKTIQSLQLNNYQPDDYITGDHLDHIHVGY